MKSLPISIISTNKTDELIGKDPEQYYTPLYFRKQDFTCFWIDTEDSNIHFYVGSQEFVCEANDCNLEKCNQLLS